MARGWESKSVEEQISARESPIQIGSGPKLTPEQLQLRARREGLLMVRARTLTALQTACDPRYRGHLEQVLADLDKQITEMNLQ